MEERLTAIEKRVADLEERLQDRQKNDIDEVKKLIADRLKDHQMSYC